MQQMAASRQLCSPRQRVAWAVLLSGLWMGQTVHAVKLRFRSTECVSRHFEMYEPFYGSFVSLPDVHYATAQYDLDITAPSGTKVHSLQSTSEGKFHLVPHETGTYKFCLSISPLQRHGYRGMDREVVWELYAGHADVNAEHAQEQDTHGLWHYVSLVDAQLQQLRSTVTYLYWRERRHRMLVDSTNARVLWFALLRSGGLVAVSVLQVVALRIMFRNRKG